MKKWPVFQPFPSFLPNALRMQPENRTRRVALYFRGDTAAKSPSQPGSLSAAHHDQVARYFASDPHDGGRYISFFQPVFDLYAGVERPYPM
jgi:hypothetical protein